MNGSFDHNYMNTYGKNIIRSIYSRVDKQSESKQRLSTNDVLLEENLKETMSYFG
jgi:hypothetical protein